MHRLAEIAAYVRLDRSGAWWGGVRIHDGPLAHDVLLTTLAQTIYANAYVRGGPRPISPEWSFTDRGRDPGLNDRLCAAATSGGREACVTVEADALRPAHEGDDSVVVRHGGLRLSARRADVVDGRVVVPALRPRQQPGFFLALSDAPAHAGAVTRVYWHLLGSDAALHLVELVTATLNAERCSFELKVGTDPTVLGRTDSGVLYLPSSESAVLVGLLGEVHASLASAGHLGPGTPMWTRRLGHGVGAAQDPGGGESFGEVRSRQAARALIEAAESGVLGATDRLAVAVAAWARQGVDLRAPYVKDGGPDLVSELPGLEATTVSPRWPVRAASGPGDLDHAADPGDVLRAVVDDLAERAVSVSGKATWLTMTAGDDPEGAPLLSTTGFAVYDGTAGIALALAYGAAALSGDHARSLAVSALACALDHCEEAGWVEGFYSGTAGVLAVAEVVADLCDAPSLRRRAHTMLGTLWADDVGDHDGPGFDVISGLAGTILGLATCTAELARAVLAVRVDRLIAQSESPRGDVLQWPGPSPEQWPWTGFAHGATGIGVALAAAARVLERDDLRDAARAAVRYEDRWYEPSLNNWADLRNVDRTVVPEPETRRFAHAWCHGAPGIRAGRRLIDGDVEAPSQLDERMVEAAPDSSLCHGYLGLVDLGVAASVSTGRATAVRQAQLIEMARDQNYAGPVPGLMVGTAGTIYAAARLLQPELSSVLTCLQ